MYDKRDKKQQQGILAVIFLGMVFVFPNPVFYHWYLVINQLQLFLLGDFRLILIYHPGVTWVREYILSDMLTRAILYCLSVSVVGGCCRFIQKNEK